MICYVLSLSLSLLGVCVTILDIALILFLSEISEIGNLETDSERKLYGMSNVTMDIKHE